jgi:hypothetical protein
MYIVKTNPT